VDQPHLPAQAAAAASIAVGAPARPNLSTKRRPLESRDSADIEPAMRAAATIEDAWSAERLHAQSLRPTKRNGCPPTLSITVEPDR